MKIFLFFRAFVLSCFRDKGFFTVTIIQLQGNGMTIIATIIPIFSVIAGYGTSYMLGSSSSKKQRIISNIKIIA
jgi:hypothetical protein